MNIKLEHKLFYSILGMPSSGTSIIQRFFSSLNDSHSLSEPLTIKSKVIRLEGLPMMTVTGQPRMFISKYKELALSRYKLAGFKEVALWRPGHINRIELVIKNLDLFDFTIFVIREPIENVNSILRRRGEFDHPDFIHILQSLTHFYNLVESTEKSYIIHYESFCQDPIGHINRQLGDILKIEGGLKLSGIESGAIRCDRRAWKSNVIKLGGGENLLTDSQKDLILDMVGLRYQNLLQKIV